MGLVALMVVYVGCVLMKTEGFYYAGCKVFGSVRGVGGDVIGNLVYMLREVNYRSRCDVDFDRKLIKPSFHIFFPFFLQ